jgi:uncharacterized protein YbbK (DUF523 family)
VAKPLVGVSACLLGRAVRYDGGHKLDEWIKHELGRMVEFVAVCPEAEAGLGVPRQAMRLVRGTAGPRLVGLDNGRDITAGLLDYSEAKLEELARLPLAGFVLKSRSPSCGLAVAVTGPEGEPDGTAPGLFAWALRRRFPELPVIQEIDLVDLEQRQAFLRLLS